MAELDTSQSKGKKGKKKHRTKKSSTRVDLTPMVDLGFLLVTFFMMTTTFSKPQTMEVNMPVKPKNDVEVKAPELAASKALTIIVASESKIFWYMGTGSKDNVPTQSNFSPDGIRKILLEKNKNIKDMMVLIKPADDCNYKNVVDILDEMNISSVKRYALIDITSEDIELIKNL